MVVKRRLVGGLLALAMLLAACSGKDAKDTPPANTGSFGGASGAASETSNAGSDAKAGASSQGGSGSVGPSTPLADFPAVYAAALCSALARCWTAFIDATDGVDGCARLFERVGRDGVFDPIGNAVADGRLTYHPEQLPACLQALEAASCAGYDDVVCPDLFVGTKRAGEACSLDEECAGDSQCLVQDSCPGTCGPRPALGEACTDANRCSAGLQCASRPDATQACVTPAGLAEKCGTFLPCAGLLYCKGADIGSTETDGTCVERGLPHDGEQGEACDGLGVDRLCKLGLVCSFVQENGETVGRCHPRAAADEACIYSMPDACPADQYCHIDTELGVKPATGTCTPRPKLGEICRYGTIHVAPCHDTEHVCHPDTEVCVTSKSRGEACTHDDECSGDCDSSGHCVARLECEEASADAM